MIIEIYGIVNESRIVYINYNVMGDIFGEQDTLTDAFVKCSKEKNKKC